MLFCDGCDKAYHMYCHAPIIQERPQGKWLCYRCLIVKTNFIPSKFHFIIELILIYSSNRVRGAK